MDFAEGLRALVVALATGSSAGAAQTVGKPRAIRVVLDDDYAPFAFRSDDGSMQGILVDQWRAWERKTGVRAEIQAMDWDQAVRRMRAGEFDVIDAIVETPERRGDFDYTRGYATVQAAIFFRKEISGITDLASLKGFPVGVKAGDQHVDRLREDGVTTVIPFHNYREIVNAAKRHQIGVFVADTPAALYLLNKSGIDGDFRHSAPVFRDELRRAVHKGDLKTLRLVSEGFAAIAPGQLRQIDAKWFGQPVNTYGRYLGYAGYAAAAALLLIFGLFAWNRALSREILQRTAALAESEQRSRLIIDTIPAMVWCLRPDSIIDFVNRRWADYTGVSLEEAIKAPTGTMHPDDLPRAMDRWRVDQAAGSPSEDEMRLRRADGTYRWFLVRTVPLRDAQGNISSWYGTSTDIEDRKRAEEKLRQSEDNLKATSEQLRALSARLRSAREEEGIRIAREIHDELGATLTSLRWDLEAVRKTVSEPGKAWPSGELREKLTAMLALTDTMINIVRRIASDLRPAVLDVLGLEEAIEWQARQFEDRTGIAVHYESAGTDLALNPTQSTAVFRIFQEALTNVLRHARATRVDVTVVEDTGVFVLMIGDNGRGITESERTGERSIGLLGMRERAHLIGGEIDVGGAEGEGSTVILRLPMREA
jgi:PAS domain S-box-containing protein